jgi:hypothetical protein
VDKATDGDLDDAAIGEQCRGSPILYEFVEDTREFVDTAHTNHLYKYT